MKLFCGVSRPLVLAAFKMSRHRFREPAERGDVFRRSRNAGSVIRVPVIENPEHPHPARVERAEQGVDLVGQLERDVETVEPLSS